MKFLVAIDGSEAADHALAYALDLVGDAELTIVHSVQPEVYTESVAEPVHNRTETERLYVLDSIDDAEERGERLLEEAGDHASEADVAVETVLLFGNPALTVPDYAEAHDFDGIFVGHRGLSARAESMLGSVAKELIGRSSVPVTVVR